VGPFVTKRSSHPIVTPLCSKVFRRWIGPGIVREKRPHNSYIVEIDSARRHLHADKLRKYHVSVDEVLCTPVVSSCSATGNSNLSTVNQCAIIYDKDTDFGNVEVIEPTSEKDVELLPSLQIDPEKLAHLYEQQRKELLAVLDEFPVCFSEKPGFCNLMQHEIHVSSDFKPKRLRSYRVPENLKPQVEKQIQEMLVMGIITPSKLEMASPIVCVLKGKGGKDGVRIAVDYRYLNKYCTEDAYPLPDISSIIQRVGQGRFISTFDGKGAYF